jgi:hypothetical protein
MEDLEDTAGPETIASGDDHSESIRQLENMFYSLPMIDVFRGIRDRIAALMNDLRKGTANIRDAQETLIAAKASFHIYCEEQDRWFRRFLERERMEKLAKPN